MSKKKTKKKNVKKTGGGSTGGPMPITDNDLISLDKLIGRYGQDELIRKIHSYDAGRVQELMSRAIRFRQAVVRVMEESP